MKLIINVYSLKDEIDCFGTPLLFGNDAQAMRAIKNAYEVPHSIYQTAPQDYTLYRIGEFNTDTGRITNRENVRICSCSDFRKE